MFGVRDLPWTLFAVLSAITVESASTQWFDSTPLLQPQQQQQQQPQVVNLNIPALPNQNAQQDLRFSELPIPQQTAQQFQQPVLQQQQQPPLQQQQQNFQDQLQQQQLVQQQLQLVQQQLQQLSSAAVQQKVDQRQQQQQQPELQQPLPEQRQSILPAAAPESIPADVVTQKPQPKPALKVTPPAKVKGSAATEKNTTGTPSAANSRNSTTDDAAAKPAPVSWIAGFEPLVSAGVATLGATLGKDQCQLKAACLVASMLPNVQGRDLVIVAAERLVPDNWKPIYNAARSSLLQGQSCLQYDCTL